MASPVVKPESVELEQHIHYIPCPVCGGLMNRVQFANCSHVIVNVCNQHGTWFDRDELRRIVEFIQSGGLVEARAREIADLERERREAEGHAVPPDLDAGTIFSTGKNYDLSRMGIGAAAGFLRVLLRR
jgi:Zn-finger nucleic acid-binding protein